MGNVTTIGGQVTAVGIVLALFLASAVNMLVPVSIASRQLAGRSFVAVASESSSTVPASERYLMFFLGLGVLVLVPAFKQWTHSPPFMGILFGLGILRLVGDLVQRGKEPDDRERKTFSQI